MRLALLCMVSALACASCQAPTSAPAEAPPTAPDARAPAAADAVATVNPLRTTGPNGPMTLALDPIPTRQGGQVQVSARGFSDGEEVAILASRGTPGSDM